VLDRVDSFCRKIWKRCGEFKSRSKAEIRVTLNGRGIFILGENFYFLFFPAVIVILLPTFSFYIQDLGTITCTSYKYNVEEV